MKNSLTFNCKQCADTRILQGIDVIKSEFASRKHLEVHALKEQVGALTDEALDHIYEHGNEEPGLAPIYWQVKPLSVRIESKMARLRAAQDMLVNLPSGLCPRA